MGAGLKGERSGTFYPFWRAVSELIADGRAPTLVALENVCGTLTSHEGRDFEAICRTFARAGYRCGAVVIDAELFVPHSPPRLFVVGVREEIAVDPALLSPGPIAPFHTRGLCTAVARLPDDLRERFLWWNVPTPERRTSTFADLIEETPAEVVWHTPAETRALLAKMSPINQAKLAAAKRARRRMVGGVYRRTRLDESGVKVQRAEVRFDDVAGCLRTPAGGSSRQLILVDLAPHSMRSRRKIVEHPFGTIKAWTGSTHLLMKRLTNVKTEISLHVLAYNMKRVIAILGATPLMATMQA